ncbi:MAG TPA: glycosyltransferase family 2 protein, partial [Humisphaera sp.]|nr:glycosyltransferase family 2 protein [Humisphaera sp.]
MTSESPPLVSCIMPTCDRRVFVPRAIAYFQRQDYPNKELIVVDDGADSIADLIPAGDERVRYVRLAKRTTVGGKRNLACEKSESPLIAHWDDDDWHAPRRLRYQVEQLLKSQASICGLKTLLFLDTRDGRAWQYNYPDGQRGWLSGNSLLYTREFW